MKENCVEPRLVYAGPVFKVRSDEIEIDGKPARRDYVEHPGAAAVLPITTDKDIVLVRQYRYAVRNKCWEIPAGKLEDEAPIECAKRELREEIGGTSNHWAIIRAFYPSVGYSSEAIHLFMARNVVFGPAAPDEGEHVEVEIFKPWKVLEMMDQGAIVDAKTIIALMWYERWNRK